MYCEPLHELIQKISLVEQGSEEEGRVTTCLMNSIKEFVGGRKGEGWDAMDLSQNVYLKVRESCEGFTTHIDPEVRVNAARKWLRKIVHDEHHDLIQKNNSPCRIAEADADHREFDEWEENIPHSSIELDEDDQQVVGEHGRRAAFTSPSKYDKEEKKRQDARRYQRKKAQKSLNLYSCAYLLDRSTLSLHLEVSRIWECRPQSPH